MAETIPRGIVAGKYPARRRVAESIPRGVVAENIPRGDVWRELSRAASWRENIPHGDVWRKLSRAASWREFIPRHEPVQNTSRPFLLLPQFARGKIGRRQAARFSAAAVLLLPRSLLASPRRPPPPPPPPLPRFPAPFHRARCRSRAPCAAAAPSSSPPAPLPLAAPLCPAGREMPRPPRPGARTILEQMREMGSVRDWAPPGWHWEVLSSGARTLVRNPGPIVDPDILWWRSRGPRSFQREPAPQEVVAQRIREEDEHVRRYLYALDTRVIVRDTIPITTQEWKKPAKGDEGVTYVDTRSKNLMFRKLLVNFILPEPTDSDSENDRPDPEDPELNSVQRRVKKWALKKMAVQFNDYKKKLDNFFVKKKKTPDFNGLYEKIKDHWEEFVKYKTSERSKTRSETNKKNAANKMYFHTMGRGGYKAGRPKWEKWENDLIEKGIHPEMTKSEGGASWTQGGPHHRRRGPWLGRHHVVWGPQPFRLLFFAKSFVRKPKPRGYLAKSYTARAENTRERALRGQESGEGEIDAITVIELDIISITIIIISTIITAVSTAGHRHRRSNLGLI
ncbi:hypothetical protein QYE76_058823 [Lolium multiflorum]|uniref:Uncharacterized protein n=1 Tax=Lolium multiflorum TaxID=4521 RepID=A0AAD8T788_LOLMU|nr:hypothetical protein QYE76_058823 [Lolium multiflorum]